MTEKLYWKGYSGPFDARKEEIISIFEKRAGLSPNMAYMPRIANVKPCFHNGDEQFTYNMNTMHAIGGEIKGIEFKIHLCLKSFTCDPGRFPLFHFHSISEIEIPGKIIQLFRGYPEYYTYIGDVPIARGVFHDLMVFHQQESPMILSYKPESCYVGDDFWAVRTNLTFHRQDKKIPNLDDFPVEITWEKIFQEFDGFLQRLVELLKTTPVTTRT
jgi:hypothetical protein